jgi:AhpD family alkylhydroperoxidase
MASRVEEFRRRRERQNEHLLAHANLETKRFFALDEATYRDGALDARTKELLGLVASTVLRCDDCIAYHLIRCAELGLTDDEYREAMNVALVVGGSITIPHLRRAEELWGELQGQEEPRPQQDQR